MLTHHAIQFEIASEMVLTDCRLIHFDKVRNYCRLCNAMHAQWHCAPICLAIIAYFAKWTFKLIIFWLTEKLMSRIYGESNFMIPLLQFSRRSYVTRWVFGMHCFFGQDLQLFCKCCAFSIRVFIQRAKCAQEKHHKISLLTFAITLTAIPSVLGRNSVKRAKYLNILQRTRYQQHHSITNLGQFAWIHIGESFIFFVK